MPFQAAPTIKPIEKTTAAAVKISISRRIAAFREYWAALYLGL
jgi:hypothetical protein